MHGEPPTGPYEERLVLARKQHVCVECNRAILPGETYHQAKGLWTGGWKIFRTCSECEEVRERLFDLVPDVLRDDELPAFGHLLEYAREYDIERRERS